MSGARVVLLLLSDFWPANVRKIAERLGYCETHTRRLLTSLCDQGILVVEYSKAPKGRPQRVYALAGYDFKPNVIKVPLDCIRSGWQTRV